MRRWRVWRLLLLTAATLGTASARPCSYKTPRVEEVETGVPMEDAVEEEGSGRSRRQLFPAPSGLEANFRPLRIALHLDASLGELSPAKRRFVKEQLLPAAVGFWERVLSVRRSSAPIRLNRKCASAQYYLHPSHTRQACAQDCKAVTKCGEVPVPDSHLFQCRYCRTADPATCGVKGVADGRGVAGADFLFYVSAVASPRCRQADTVAYAAHCQQEAALDRPIAGHVNLCPDSVSEDDKDQEVLLSTLKHEILHALGFSAGLYAFFRDDQGLPRTPRNEYGKPLRLNKQKGYYEWSNETVAEITRPNWWTRGGRVRHKIWMMKTPRVVREARAQLACANLEGGELENQGSDGTALTHWEKRLFENEAMTGTHTQNPVYSRLTLALMEDSGWYKADYALAQELRWGRGLGCEFALKSCGEWMAKRPQDPHPFCKQVKGWPASTTTCTEARDSVALCNLVEYDIPLPPEYQAFASLPGLPPNDSARFGGSVELADYCPYNQEFEWKNDSLSPVKRDSRCEFASNTPLGINNAALEDYAKDAKCFNHVGKWTQRQCGFTRTFQHYGAGCYQLQCRDGRLWLSLLNGTVEYPCYAQGQRIQVRRLEAGWLHSGILVCPACAELCPANLCLPDRLPPPMIQDPPLAEPCCAAKLRLALPLLPLLFLLHRAFQALSLVQ